MFLHGVNLEQKNLEELLYKATKDEAIISFSGGVVRLDFTIDANHISDAINSAEKALYKSDVKFGNIGYSLQR